MNDYKGSQYLCLMIRLCLFLLFCCCTGLSAQHNPLRPVSLPEALSLALEHSAVVKKARLDREALDERLREGRSSILPKINATGSFDVFPVLPTQFLPGEVLGSPETYVPVQLGQPWQLTGSLSVEQTLYSEAARRKIPAARISRDVYDLLTLRTEDDVVFNTASLFYQTLQIGQLLRAVDANATKLDALRRIAELQLANGFLTPTDVKRLRVARTNLETQRQNLVTNISALRQTLQFLCNVPFEQPFDPAEALNDPAADSLRWQNLVFQIEQTTEHRLLRSQVALNRVQASSLRAEAMPNLTAYAAGLYQTQRADYNFLNSNGRWFGMAAVGLKIQLPVFDGFQRRHKVALLNLEGRKLETDLAQFEQAKNLEFRQARDQLQNALGQLRTQSENVGLAREIIDKLALQYKEGVAPLTDLLNAQTALSEAESNYWQQAFGYKLAVLKLLKAVGRLGELRV